MWFGDRVAAFWLLAISLLIVFVAVGMPQMASGALFGSRENTKDASGSSPSEENKLSSLSSSSSSSSSGEYAVAARVRHLTADLEDLRVISREHSNLLQRQEALLFELKEDMRIMKMSLKNLGQKVVALDETRAQTGGGGGGAKAGGGFGIKSAAVDDVYGDDDGGATAAGVGQYMKTVSVLEERYEETSSKLSKADAKIEKLEKEIAELAKKLQEGKSEDERQQEVKGVLDHLSNRKSLNGGLPERPKTCHDIFEAAGIRKSGRYAIYPEDSVSEAATPLLAFCDGTTGETVLNHDVSERGQFVELTYCAGGCAGMRTIQYLGGTDAQIRALIDASAECHQEITYECFGAPIHGADGTARVWWEDRNGARRSYWHGDGSSSLASSAAASAPAPAAASSSCACAATASCVEPHRRCNCDASAPEWLVDAGNLTDKDVLPVKKLAFDGLKFSSQKGRLKLGPLRCSGRAKGPDPVTSVTSCGDVKRSGQRHTGYYFVESTKAEDRYELVFCNLNLKSTDKGFQTSTGVTLAANSQNKQELVGRDHSSNERGPDERRPATSASEDDPAEQNRKNRGSPQVVFDVVKQEHQFLLGPIVFPHTEVNIGDAMDNATGIFTAPVTGVYAFSFHAWNNMPTASDIYVHRNDRTIVARAFSFAVGVYGTDFKVVMNAGDKIRATLVRGSIYGDVGKLTRFSGHLIHALSER